MCNISIMIVVCEEPFCLEGIPTVLYNSCIMNCCYYSFLGPKAVKTAADLLCSRYEQNRYISVDDWPPYHPKHYTPLAIVHHEGRCTEAEVTAFAQGLTMCGSVTADRQPSNIYNDTIKTVKDLCVPLENTTSDPYAILIEGAPGIGKTILCKEIALQWSRKDILKSKSLLFLLFMREPEIESIKDVKSLVRYFCQGDDLTDSVTDWLVENDGKNLGIVIDGYDEATRNSKQSFICNGIVNRSNLSKCSIVITSRPAASLSLHPKVNCRAEVLGFTEENRLNFIESALKNQNDEIKKLKSFLKLNPMINALCYIPLNMSILLCLTQDGIDMLPKTKTKLYSNFIIMTIRHFLSKSANETAVINSLDTLPHPHDQAIRELSQFAFLALEKDKLVFTHAELKVACPNLTPAGWYKLGLLKQVQHFSPRNSGHNESFHFLHFSVQEYMAAHYIKSLPSNKLLKKLNNTFWKPRYFNMWIMYVGITGGTHPQFQTFLSGSPLRMSRWQSRTSNLSSEILNDKIKRLYLLHCLAEGDHEIFLSVESIFQGQKIDLSNQSLSPHDVLTVAMSLVKSSGNQLEEINLSNCNIDEKGSNILCQIFNSQEVVLTVKKTDISYNWLPRESLTLLCKNFEAWNCETVTISIDSLYDSATMNNISWFASKLNSEIQKTVVSGTIPPYLPTDVRSRKLLCTYLPELKRLVTVYLEPQVIQVINYSDCTLSNHMIEVLRKLALEKKITTSVIVSYYIAKHHNINFPNINLCGSSMHAKNAFQIERSNISMIHPYYACWYEYIADLLAAVICHNAQTSGSYLKTLAGLLGGLKLILPNTNTSILKEFNIENNYLGSEAADDIALILSQAVNLQKLLLGRNSLNTGGVIKIVNAMHQVSKLRILDISSNNIDANAADDIATFLAHNTKLSELYLGGNNLCMGTIKVMQGLKRTSTLTILDLASNNINDKVTDEIATVLSHNVKLKELYLNGNNLQAAGIFKITRVLQSTSCIKVFKVENNYANFKPYIYQVVCAHMFTKDLESFLFRDYCPLQVYLCGNTKYEDSTVREPDKSILKPLLTASKLTIFDIDQQITTEESYVARDSDGILMMLDTKSGNMSEVTVNDVASVLAGTKIKVLHLHGNNLQARNTLKILGALKGSKNLSTFDIENNNDISDNAVDDIKCIVSNNKKLQKFNAGGNNLGVAKANIILQALLSTYLTLFNVSNNNLSDEAADNIAAVLRHNTKLQELYLSKNNLRTSGITEVARSLKEITTLTVLDISNNDISAEAADSIATILQFNCKLQKLYLQNNNLQSVGIIKITDALQTLKTLEIFDISHNSVGIEAESSIAGVMHKNSKLEKLYLGENNLHTWGSIASHLHSSLVVLSIPGNGITYEAVDDIAVIICRNTGLQVLDLCGNNFGTQGAIKILKALKNHSNLIHLNIENNNIDGSTVADDLAAVLSHNKDLQKLYLGDVKLKSAGIFKIQNALQHTSKLIVFSLSNNNIDYVAADSVTKVLSCNEDMQELYLARNNLQAHGIIKITRALHNTSSLKVFNVSNNNISDKAANDIAAVLSHNNKLEVLNVRNNKLETAGIIKIVKALKNASCLTVLDISGNNIDSDAANDIAIVLSCNCKLKRLYLQGSNLKVDGVIKIAKGLRGTASLITLNVSNNDISDEAADDIATIFSHNSKLQVVELHGNMFQHIGITKMAKALQTISTLTVFSISDNRIGSKAAKDIAIVLNRNTKLKVLCMGKNCLEDHGITEIMNALQNSLTLRILDISQNNINQNAVKDIAAILYQSTQLCQLYLGKNCLQNGIMEIMHSLRNITTLTVLDISENRITDEAADMIAAVLSSNIKLQELYVGGNNLQATGVVIITRALKCTVTLEVINFSNNNIGDEAANDVSAVISHSTKLRSLHLVGANINVPGILKIAKALQTISSLIVLNISNNKISGEAVQEVTDILSSNSRLQLHI